MKSPHLASVGGVMATKCSSAVSVTTDHVTVHMRKHRGHRNEYAHRRKSAVELLAASKPQYVKSSTVLNQKQELKHPENLSVRKREPLPLSLTPVKSIDIDDPCVDVVTENNNNRKSPAGERVSPIHIDNTFQTKHVKNDENSSRIQSASKSLKTHQLSSESTHSNSSHSNSEEQVVFKKPPSPKPIVPPRPLSGSKPTTPPKPSPRTSSQGIVKTPGKPLPPPRPSRKPLTNQVSGLDVTDSPQSNMAASCDKKIPSAGVGAVTTVITSEADTVTKRFSSLSAHASVGYTKESNDKEGQNIYKRESHNSFNSQNDCLLKPLCSSSLSTSVGVLLEKKRSPAPRPRKERQLAEVEIPPRRQLHRSHSDLSSCRHSRTDSDFSDLSSRYSRTSTEVERFFNEMGIDRTVLEPMRKLVDTRPQNFLDSLSSLGSQDCHSISSRLSQNDDRLPMESEQDLLDRGAPGTTSKVERNARIIKWLCNVKKARTAPKPQTSPTNNQTTPTKASLEKS